MRMDCLTILSILVAACIGRSNSVCYDGVTELCHGLVNCTNGEKQLPTSSSGGNWTRCISQGTGECILQREQICYGEVTCADVEDLPCEIDCKEYYRCQKSNGCFKRSTICDGNTCTGCPEDHEWHNGPGFKCLRNGKECILPQQLLHDIIADCDGDADICFTGNRSDILDQTKCFQCLNGQMLIPSSRVCDGMIDCSDLSDECLCEEKVHEVCKSVVAYEKVISKKNRAIRHRCSFGQVMCGNGACINRSSLCDGIRDCNNDENYSLCGGTVRCVDANAYEPLCRCTSHQLGCYNFYGTACDGVADCPVPSYQELQNRGKNTFPQDECEASCPHRNFTCLVGSFFVGTGVGLIQCVHENYTTNIETPNPMVCDGYPDCQPNGEDEKYCGPTRFFCRSRSLVNIKLDQVCDGTIDCDNGDDEAVELCGHEKFYCPTLGGKKVSVPISAVCDFNINCDNGEDEMNCTDDRFYCENADPLFVRRRQTFDGRGDCSDWSDECPTIDQPTDNDAFSSRYELISNPVLRVLVWIMGLLALVGNITVIWKELLALRQSKKLPAAVKANRVLILNLAFSDILMGIYLIGLAIAGLRMQGVYCSQDLYWRSSTPCIALGILSVISSETSVATMVLLTGSRLYSVLRPFKSASRPRIRHILLGTVLAWMFALTIALIPMSASLSNIFVERVKFSYSPFSRNVQMSLGNAKTLFRRMMTYAIRQNTTINVDVDDLLHLATWSDLRAASEKYFEGSEYFQPQQYFGYYSIHSVCIPKFFVTTSDPAWKFSLAMNIFNFVAFIFVASAYVVIYAKTRKTKGNAGRDNAKDKTNNVLERKILRLIATDFCCWMPICIMAFCKLGGVAIGGTAYAVAAVVLLPINSALNPIVYSDLLDVLHRLCTPSKTAKSRDEGANSSRTRSTHI